MLLLSFLGGDYSRFPAISSGPGGCCVGFIHWPGRRGKAETNEMVPRPSLPLSSAAFFIRNADLSIRCVNKKVTVHGFFFPTGGFSAIKSELFYFCRL